MATEGMSPSQARHEHPEAYAAGYIQGVSEAGARLIGAVASELGYEHPLLEKMVKRLGQLSP